MRGLFLRWLTILFWGITVLSPTRADDKTGGEEEPVEPARLGTARFLNVGRVFCLAYSSDGQLLASGAWDGSIRLWDLASGKMHWQLPDQQGMIESLAFSPDGKLLVFGGREAGVCLVNTSTGQLVRRLGENQGSTAMVAFSPDGKQVGGIVRGAFHLWDAATGKELWRQGGDRVHRHFAFLGSTGLTSISLQPVKQSQDQIVPVLDSQLDLAVWDLQTRKQRGASRQLKAVLINRANTWTNQDAPTAMDRGGKTIAILSSQSWSAGEGEIQILDVETQILARKFKVNRQDISLLCLSPDGRMLASAGNPWGDGGPGRASNYIQIWEVATGRERCRFRSPDEGKTSLAFSPDLRTLASGSLDTTVLLWNLTGHQAKQGKIAPVQLTGRDLDGLWNALKGDDTPRAYRAIWKLALAPKDALPFLSKHLRPAAGADAERIKHLIRDLADERYEVREKATRELAGYKQLAEPALRQAVQKPSDLEHRLRIERLLEQLQNPSFDQLQEMRAIETLEAMHTLEGEKLLRHLAGGAPAALLTREARASLERVLGGKGQ
jgi:WD40 repeat protein